MKKYEFRYRLTQKSSLAAIAKAVRAMNMELIVYSGYISISWYYVSSETGREMWTRKNLKDEDVAGWLNRELEEKGLLAPIEPEP